MQLLLKDVRILGDIFNYGNKYFSNKMQITFINFMENIFCYKEKNMFPNFNQIPKSSEILGSIHPLNLQPAISHISQSSLFIILIDV